MVQQSLRLGPLRLVLILVLLSAPNSHCLQLDLDGGYHIVAAIADSDVAQVGSMAQAKEYINSVKEMLDSFSIVLRSSTEAKFHLKSVQILLPASWHDGFEIEANVSMATYDGADLQISEFTDAPIAENYYPCGKPGVRIQLPVWFLDANRTRAEFGSQSKGLFNLWLRYRFGIWEEHGYPQHPTTPYFHRSNDVEHDGSVHEPWRLTSCNGSELFGELHPVNSNSIMSTDCHLHNILPLDKSCRFHPYPDPSDNHVNTSLMNFQWVESIQALCNSDTHDVRAPNRQNLYCDFRSVWEVIESSEDYRAVKMTSMGPLDAVPKVQYNVVIPNSKPLLYILLDLGHPDFTWKSHLYDRWMTELEAFVHALPPDVYVTLGSYPNVQDLSTGLVRNVDWTLLDGAKRTEILRVLNFMVGTNLADKFNFRLPLAEALSELKQKARGSANGVGSVLLVLRTKPMTFAEFVGVAEHVPGPYEEDFVVEFRQHGVSLFAVEYVYKNNSTNITLEYLTSQSSGMYTSISDWAPGPVLDTDIARMRSVLISILDVVSKDSDEGKMRRMYEIIYKEMLANFSQTSFFIPRPIVCDWQFVYVYVSVAGTRFDYVELVLTDSDTDSSHVPFSERTEWLPWGDQLDKRLSYTYSATVNLSESVTVDTKQLWELRLFASSRSLGWMKGTVTVYGVRASDKEACGGGGSRTPIKAEIFTSAGSGNTFGCVNRAVNEEPLAVYAKLESEAYDSQSVRREPILIGDPFNTATVSVLLVHLRTGSSITTALRDDGVGADLLAGDGLYSGYVYPHLKDGWKLYVTVYDITNRTSVERSHVVNPMGRIQSVQQANLEVTIQGPTLTTPYSAAFESSTLIQVTGECVAKRFISRVVDTQVAVLDGDGAEFVKVTFTAPLITASESEDGDHVDGTDISDYFVGLAYLAEHVDTLINNLTHESVQVQGFLIPTTSSGKAVADVHLKRGNATAYAMVLIEPGRLPTQSPVSNIVQIKESYPEDPPAGTVGCLIGCVLLIEIAGGLVILLLVLMLLLLWRKNRTQASKLRMLSRDEVKEFLHGQKPGANTNPATNEYLDLSEQIQCLPYDSKFEIPSNKLHIDRTELLGSGSFGNVYKGYVVNHGAAAMAGKVLVVAIKTMKPDMDKSYFKVLLTEVKLMTHIDGQHPNIIRLVGACTKNIRKCQVFLATEFCPNGNLSAYLLKLDSTVSTQSLIKWAREIASGLEFLGRSKIVHGDLAARNILLDANLVAKVSDFGLSKQSLQYAKYEEQSQDEKAGGGLLPWKWVAPEVLTYGKFSVSSDVWSYGITLWEIFSLGQIPYPGIQWSPDFVHKLEHAGLRLVKPSFAADAVYDIMSSCWALDPKERPGFNKLKSGFDQMMVNTAVGEYLLLQVATDGN